MSRLLLAALAGGLAGTLMRYLTGLWLVARYPRHFFLATLVVNLAGCLIIGYLHGFFVLRPELPGAGLWRAGLMLGFLGALTTFSSFSLDTLRLLENGQVLLAMGYLLLTVTGGLLACWAGLLLARL